MKKIVIMLTSLLLCMTMLMLGPMQTVAAAAEIEKKIYISEVKVGMGETSDEAAKELLAEGYTILTNDKGEYADLNKDAGAKSPLKAGPNQKIVYLGYKTTENAGEAITDLAVMNMNGGYSYQEYEKLISTHMDTQIKPFVDRFIATLTEYRENLKKPKDSANYKRADYYRMLLNKLTDDDTGGKPLGDLLINPTKYEMGDDAYNKLSAEEKKNHCDILTLLMQGNGQAIMLMETELTKAADSSDNTWLDRFLATDLDALTKSVKEENLTFTPSEINAELDKKYNDDTKKILEKWSVFNEILLNYDNALETAEEITKTDTSKEIALNEKMSDEELKETTAELLDTEAAMVKGSMAAEDIVVHDYLEATEYGDGTLLEFFERDASEFNDEDTIRELYPIVEALSGGQIAGLDFLSIKDMILMAITDENGFKTVDVKDMEPASIYQDVNREIYEKGGVALTSDALRQQANAQDKQSTFELSKMGIVLWTCTAVSGLAAAGSAIGMSAFKPDVLKDADKLQKAMNASVVEIDRIDQYYKGLPVSMRDDTLRANRILLEKMTYDNNSGRLNMMKNTHKFKEAAKQFSARSNICKYLAAGFSVAMAILAGFSIYTTIKEMMDYYKVNFAPIPKYIVEKTDIVVTNEKKEEVLIRNQTAYYKVVSCNRKDGSSDVEKKNHEILLDRSDLNGDVGTQWLALYSVKYENAMPILADSLKLKMGKGDAPEGYSTGIHRFGESAAFNLTSRYYCYNDPNEVTYVYFKRDAVSVKELTAAAPQNTVTGSLFSGGSLALGAVGGLAVGVAITLLFIFYVRKRKEKTGMI